MDGDLLDALTGGDGHLEVIKVTTDPLNFSPIFVFMEASNPSEILKITIYLHP